MEKRGLKKKPDKSDLAHLDKINNTSISSWFPTTKLPQGFNTRQPIQSHGLTHIHHFYSKRNLFVLSRFLEKCNSLQLKLLLTKVSGQITKRYRYTYQSGVWGAGGGPQSGTLYIPSLLKELNIIEQIKKGVRSRIKASSKLIKNKPIISVSSSTDIMQHHSNIFDYVFIDPPFGSNIMYSELALLWEAWLSVMTNNIPEAIENSVQKKGVDEYRQLMTAAFRKIYQLLKPKRWLTIEFSNTKAYIWNSIQRSISEAGFIVANVSALDKKKRSFKSVISPTAVKQDLVISAYKPSNILDGHLQNNKDLQLNIWNFIEEHLSQLQKFNTEIIIERTPRILYDRLISYYFVRDLPNPIDSIDFQRELKERYEERDGMYFTADEASYYDVQKSKHTNLQYEEDPILIVYNEEVGIKWLAQKLKDEKFVYSDIQPDWMKVISVNKGDVLPELKTLLEENFLQDEDGCWFLPDLENKAHLDLKRKKRLLKTWGIYVDEVNKPKPKKLKETSLEALRFGFESCYHQKDFKTIVKVAEKIPQNLLMEDEVLLQFYDIAVMKV